MTAGRGRSPAPFAALTAVFAVCLLSLLPLIPPSPLPATAADHEFSAERARAHVEQIAERPRPSGSRGAADTREYLVGELEALGLEPRILEAAAERNVYFTPHLAGNVANVHAVLPGSGGGGRVLLVAHYDSVPIGPGATDDGMGVATLLEVARALTSGPTPRNDVEFLFTDAEESGQLGARAFTLDPEVAGDPDDTVILNMEARGTSGPALMFEAGERASAFVPALSENTPFAGSFSDGVYRLMPNHTDFTVFEEAGYTGMNFAVVGGSARYDTPRDDLDALDERSLQDLGDAALAAASALAYDDIELDAGGDSTYLTVFGLLVHYPAWAATGLGALVVAGVAAALWTARRREVLTLRATLRAAAGYAVPLVAAAAVGWAVWRLGVLARPHFADFPFGDTYRPAPIAAGLALLAVALCGLWAGRARRRHGTPVLLAAALVWYALLTAVTTALLPEAAYLFTWPALAGAVGLSLVGRTEEASPLRTLLLSGAALVSAALFTPVVALLFPTVGLALAPVVLAVLVLALLPVMPNLASSPESRAPRALLAAVTAAGVLLAAAGVAADGVDAEHPAQVNLHYVYDDDTGEAVWLSPTPAGSSWLDRYVTGEPRDVEDTYPALYQSGGYRSGPAPVVALPVPEAEIVGERAVGDGLREVRVRLTADEDRTTVLSLYSAIGQDRLARVSVDGLPISASVNRPDTRTEWNWGFHFVAPGDGVDVVLRVRGEQELPLRLISYTADVPESALGEAPPDTVTWSAGGFGRAVAANTVTV
ncbi:M20/M25/M40 family metallo-hydrolase [Nocardiopsis sp. FIRDI 009]|uniref:M20/M25/M40 family metallo-hydrolase n=1 Tax=Nocardiopsis sp. FIRDI 009 TaxID=714197 RepID=UPI000E278D40|nr:M20/M25/M40 family metallo-hydrolase [Nocardiopsis sp. FIRDI 009]